MPPSNFFDMSLELTASVLDLLDLGQSPEQIHFLVDEAIAQWKKDQKEE